MTLLEILPKINSMSISDDAKQTAMKKLIERHKLGLDITEADFVAAVGIENFLPKSNPPKKEGNDYVSNYQRDLERQRAFRNDQRIPPMIRDRMQA